jgi:formylglycine-generating enzyme required for sulfatase activity
MAEPTALKYRAFISYSHQDTTWAKWVQRGLESFKIDKDLAGRETARGPVPDSLRPVFRDREDFTAGAALPEQTLAALDVSSALIVVCSPDSARSNYVNEETRLFKSRHPARPVIPLIVGGKPGDPERECFTPALRYKLDPKGRVTKKRVELLAADPRDEGDGKELALAKVIAGLLGLSSDDVFRRAERERIGAARRQRSIQLAFGALGWLLLVGLVGWINQDYLKEQWRWFTISRPYMVSQVRPFVLKAETEQALKPKDSFRECAKHCPEMVVVPPGTFIMGVPSDEQGRVENEIPQHEVTVGNTLAISKFEVTFDEWDACVAYGDCDPPFDGGFGRGKRPVINVSWIDAKRYVAWLSKMTGRTYRLLTEAEWEYAARAGTQTAYSWGDEIGEGNANCYGCGSEWDAKQTAPVGAFVANPFGLYDVHGNVWEWVEDCYHLNYFGAPHDGSAWLEGGDCSRRMQRGGSWVIGPEDVRSAVRFRASTIGRDDYVGLRVARTLALE